MFQQDTSKYNNEIGCVANLVFLSFSSHRN